MHIQPAGPESFAEISRLPSSPEELRLFYAGASFPWTTENLEDLYQQRSDFTVAVVDSRIAAFANLYKIKAGESAFIGNIIVANTFKRQGVGKSLTLHMLNLCREKYGATPHLTVLGSNARAIILYSKIGFKPYDVEPRTDIAGNPAVVIHMRHTPTP